MHRHSRGRATFARRHLAVPAVDFAVTLTAGFAFGLPGLAVVAVVWPLLTLDWRAGA